MQAGKLYLLPPYLTFASHDRKSSRFTIPLCTIRRVERLNARAGVYALSLALWHGMKIVSVYIVCVFAAHAAHMPTLYRARRLYS